MIYVVIETTYLMVIESQKKSWYYRKRFWRIISIQDYMTYRKTSNISRTLVGNKIVDNSDVVEASPVSAAPTTSSFST